MYFCSSVVLSVCPPVGLLLRPAVSCAVYRSVLLCAFPSVFLRLRGAPFGNSQCRNFSFWAPKDVYLPPANQFSTWGSCRPIIFLSCLPFALFRAPAFLVPLSSYPSVHLFSYPSVHLFSYPSVHLFSYPSVHLFHHPSVHLFSYPSVNLCSYPSVHLFSYPSVHLYSPFLLFIFSPILNSLHLFSHGRRLRGLVGRPPPQI